MTTLRQAAQALCDRWDTPTWKDAPHTEVFVHELKMALASEEEQTVEPVRFRCVKCKLPLPGGYACACGSDEAEEDLCEDEGCPQHGTDHVCTNPLGPVPQGWKLVPIEPTSGMRAQIPGNITFGEWVTQYKAMLSAAPQPPQADEPCYCAKNGLGKPGVSCGDCPTRDYKQLTPGEGIEDGVARVEALLDAPRVPMTPEELQKVLGLLMLPNQDVMHDLQRIEEYHGIKS